MFSSMAERFSVVFLMMGHLFFFLHSLLSILVQKEPIETVLFFSFHFIIHACVVSFFMGEDSTVRLRFCVVVSFGLDKYLTKTIHIFYI